MFAKYEFKEALKNKNISVSELSLLIHIPKSTLYRKIREDGNFSRAEIEAIRELFGPESLETVFFRKD